MQDVIAPFVLENLNCTGSEARLVDCPVATDVSFYNPAPDDYMYYSTYIRTTLPLFCNFRDGNFAFVACGATSGPGELLALSRCTFASAIHTASCWCHMFGVSVLRRQMPTASASCFCQRGMAPVHTFVAKSRI